MKTKILFVCLLSLLGVNVYSVSDYSNAHWRIYEIESLLVKDGLFDSANNALIDIFNQYDYRFAEGISLAADNLFCNLHKTWNKDSTIIDFYFRRFARSYSADNLLNFFCKCADSITYNTIKERCSFYDSIFITSVDTALIRKAFMMSSRDQEAIRNQDYIMIRIVDSLNLIELEKILEKYGTFPGVKKLGMLDYIDLRMVIHHTSPKQILDKWYNLLMQLIKDGEFAPSEVAGSIDDAIIRDGTVIDNKWAIKYTIYGTYDYKNLCIPVKDIEQTNKWRREIGLPPLEYDLKKRGTEYNEAEFIKEIKIIDE
ncbi:MAG: hypothetical protein LBG17_05835 [Bacteroidales bacterium]|nr:hypothetical protein [Bacteroidales bacterium]